MATLSGNDGSVVVGSTTVAAVRNFSVEMTADTIETTVMGQETRSYVKGLSSFSGSADIYFDPSEFDGAESTFNPTTGAVGDAPIAVKFYVKHTGKTHNQLRADMERDFFMTAPEAVEYGLADKVLTTRDT